ncbi:hypothetical protein GW17_00025391 [Ensete ventricosum]|nr:hypothetical protein GW17_00025391 [Ensete ventricosum]
MRQGAGPRFVGQNAIDFTLKGSWLLWSRRLRSIVKERVLAQVGVLLPLLALAAILVFFLTIVEGGSDRGAGESSPWAGFALDLAVAGALRSASRGMSSRWGRRRPIASSPAPPSPAFRLSIPSRIPFPSLETISKCEMVSS